MDESQHSSLPWLDEPTGLEPSPLEQFAPQTLPADGRFAGSYRHYLVIPDILLDAVVERTEAEPAAFGSFAAMGPHGSFELRRSDRPTAAALTTWPEVTYFYYAHERHLQAVLEDLGIPIIPLKKDFIFAYERVITELGQI